MEMTEVGQKAALGLALFTMGKEAGGSLISADVLFKEYLGFSEISTEAAVRKLVDLEQAGLYRG